MLDLWFEQEVKRRLRGRSLEIRFAADAALVFEREEDARPVLAVLANRLARYGLRLDSEKTRLSMTNKLRTSGGRSAAGCADSPLRCDGA